MGAATRGTACAPRALALCGDDIAILRPLAMALLGHVYAWSGRITEGVSRLKQALTDFETLGLTWLQSMGVVQFGEAYLLAGQVQDAPACADRAVKLARERGESGHEPWALRRLGDIASHPDRPDLVTAEGHYRAAMALADALGMRPLAAHCHLGLGTLYRGAGDGARAGAHLITAATMYGEMGMGFWLEKARAALTSVR